MTMRFNKLRISQKPLVVDIGLLLTGPVLTWFLIDDADSTVTITQQEMDGAR